MFTNEQLNIISACGKECERQQSGERSVVRLVRAWNWAEAYDFEAIDKDLIRDIGFIIDPIKNDNGWRKVPAVFANGNEALNTQFIEQQIDLLIKNGKDLSPFNWTQRFLEIHPFVDGNGRTAFVLYNLLTHGCDDAAIALPDFQF